MVGASSATLNLMCSVYSLDHKIDFRNAHWSQEDNFQIVRSDVYVPDAMHVPERIYSDFLFCCNCTCQTVTTASRERER